MSMTKRYIETLPQDKQDDILGLPPSDEDGLEVEYENEDDIPGSEDEEDGGLEDE